MDVPCVRPGVLARSPAMASLLPRICWSRCISLRRDFLPSADFIQVECIVQKTSFVVLKGFVRGRLHQVCQNEFHRLLVLLRIVQGHREKDLEGSALWKLTQTPTQCFLCLLILS